MSFDTFQKPLAAGDEKVRDSAPESGGRSAFNNHVFLEQEQPVLEVHESFYEAALAIADEWAETLEKMSEALLAGNEAQALVYARELCSIHEESNRANPSIN